MVALKGLLPGKKQRASGGTEMFDILVGVPVNGYVLYFSDM